MDPDREREVSERDQLWASLRVLRPLIDLVAAGEEIAPPERQRMVAQLLARVVAAELDYRARHAEG